MIDNHAYVVFIGGPCIDEYYSVGEWPAEGDKFIGKDNGRVAGGMIANASCVMAGYGVKTYSYTAFDDSEGTEFLLDDLRRYNVDPSHVVIKKDMKNDKCLIFQNGGERTILVIMPENGNYYASESDIEFFCGAHFIYSSFPQISRIINYDELLSRATKAGAKFVLDNEPATYVDNWRDIMKYCSIAFLNDYALETYGEGKSEAELLAELFALGVEVVVETLGKKGCKVVTVKDSFEVGIYDVDVVDTTGAGDTFNSSFVYSLENGNDLRSSAVFATAAANLAITKQGPRSGVASREEVEEFINTHSLLS